ncbi:MAG: O-antigen ligase family protein, partial [Actinomycetota bacterium]|nr:O-antigen ligase family protein [Actinomycetota bacterium]
METGAATDLAALAAALGAATALTSARRAFLLAGLAALAAGELALGLRLLSAEEQDVLLDAVSRPPVVTGALAVLVAFTLALVRFPSIAPVALVVAAPFRLPVDVGDERVFLLLPLYGVLAAAALALVVRVLRGERLAAPPRIVAVPAALFVVLAGASMLWAADARAASIDLVFFFFPFALLFAVVVRSPLRGWTPGALAAALVVLASAFSVVGIAQLWTDDLPLARDVEVANAYTSYERVTSLFHDPSIYGRHLALAIVVLVVLLWLGRLSALVATALIALLFAGLFVSYSQSSMVALFVAVLGVSLLAADRRARKILLASSVALALVCVAVVAAIARDESLRRVTSGRSDLVANTVSVIGAHPLVGVGIGGEEKASREEAKRRGKLAKPSHTTPLTVAAELGLVGVAAYVLLLVGAARALVLLRPRAAALATGIAGVLLVLVTHSVFYSGFFEDPL